MIMPCGKGVGDDQSHATNVERCKGSSQLSTVRVYE